MSPSCNVLLVCPRFNGHSFWNFTAACEVYGARFPAAPLGLITVAALLPSSWNCRLINRNTEKLTDADLDWADLVMTGGMLPQRPDTQTVIELAQAHGKPVVIGGPDVTSAPQAYAQADFQVLGEAEGVIDAFIEAWNSGARSGVFEAEKFKIDVTKTPIPRFDLLKRDQYVYYGVQFARGCPFNCEFCDIIELYGRMPRVKTVEQILAELQTLYDLGYRGHLDFVDDNFIGNKKAVKALLPHLIAWQKAHGYPFEFSTEASLNLADDDALLALMREARFFVVFVGIESPDTDTLVSMQKKQNTRRVVADSVHKIYRAGMLVIAGFIVGFDSEKEGVADAMIECIEATAIPVCMVGLLYALPNTQLTRRLEREGRLFPQSYTGRRWEQDAGDQCTSGLNFITARPRREILADYKKILQAVYDPAAYYARVRTIIRMLGQPTLSEPALDKHGAAPSGVELGGISRADLVLLWRMVWRIALRQPRALVHFGRSLYLAATENPRALEAVGMLTVLYLHLHPFSRFVIGALDSEISIADSDEFRAPATSTHLAAHRQRA
ncbi:MAG TPA: B12-binding domain-containing radical SAM protein [Stellaceae bacterium]|nr:B12-binding domain-containing radical SAM protein [Stellaceae bacterium]